MKYIITSKHHDGFAFCDSEVIDYDAVDYAAINKDLQVQLRGVCDKHNMKIGFYYSIMEWHHPDGQAPDFKNPSLSA